MLLTYHDPEIFKHLENNNIIPEMYCIPWFITYFASRVSSVEIVLELWDRMARSGPLPDSSNKEDQGAAQMSSSAGSCIGDPTFIFFFAVALIVQNRMRILKADPAELPSTMAQLSVETRKELHELIKLAESVEENTPFSFKQLDEIKCLFMRGQQSPERLHEISLSLESLSCMPLLPAELFFYSFPGEIECPNP